MGTKKRNFIIFYQASIKNGTSTGYATIGKQDRYINSEEMKINLIEMNKEFKSVIITNILELNDEDFSEFIRK